MVSELVRAEIRLHVHPVARVSPVLLVAGQVPQEALEVSDSACQEISQDNDSPPPQVWLEYLGVAAGLAEVVFPRAGA